MVNLNTAKKKKKKIVGIIWLCIIAAAAVILIIRATRDNTDYELQSRIMQSHYDLSDSTSTCIRYEDYVMANGDTFLESGCELRLSGNEYQDITQMQIEDMQDGCILTDKEGKITYAFDVEKSGYYYIEVGYYPSADSDKNIVRKLYINGEIPFEEAQTLSFERMWVDSSKSFLMVNTSNQASPTQVQSPDWISKKLDCQDKTVDGSLMFYLEAGKNELTLESVSAPMGISHIALIPASEKLSYSQYIDLHKNATIINSDEIENAAIIVQAEDTLYKSSATLLPQNNRNSPCTMPYHPSNIVLNTIGGTSWEDAGTSITWKVAVPKAGLYKIASRYLQAENRDFYSVREIKINGEVPFVEAGNISFDYDTDFRIDYFGDNEKAYYFYLNEGENTITMTVSLGNLTYAITQSRISVKNFNSLYRSLTAVMSSEPDQYRDYKIEEAVPDFTQIMETEYYRLTSIMESLGEDLNHSTKTREVAKMVYQLQDLIEKPDLISKQLKIFNNNITAISEWMLSLDEQPLTLDYLIVTGDDYKLPRAEGNFFMKRLHGFRAFVGSFTNDYSIKSDKEIKKEKKIVVWIATATRDQFDIAQKMIINSFADADFEVELKMVGAGTVMPATLTGFGPDVAIQLNYTMPTNFAYRNAGYDLTQFQDFSEVAGNFAPGAMEYFEYEGGIYALPDEMSFPVLFYRKDILEDMGLKVPTTWEELEAMLPYLQGENMMMYFTTTDSTVLGGASQTTTKQINPIFTSLLYQRGIELYSEDGTRSNLDSKEALLTFKKWTEYYSKDSLPVSISIVTRFRTGDVPVMITDYTNMNTIFAAAPEIDGQWSIAPIPGTVKSDGTVDKSVNCNVGAAMILKGSVEKNDTANEAWEFLKWWTSKDTQLTYSKEQKTILGDSGNYPVANLEAIKEMATELGFLDAVEETLKWSRGIPQVPGGYISGRYVENSFLRVYNENLDPVDTLYSNVRFINQEIKNKREEFGLSD